jgi:hypothetical protein
MHQPLQLQLLVVGDLTELHGCFSAEKAINTLLVVLQDDDPLICQSSTVCWTNSSTTWTRHSWMSRRVRADVRDLDKSTVMMICVVGSYAICCPLRRQVQDCQDRQERWWSRTPGCDLRFLQFDDTQTFFACSALRFEKFRAAQQSRREVYQAQGSTEDM